MNRDVMSVRLWLPLIVVLGVVVDAPERLSVRVASSVRRPRCPDCAAPSGTVHDRRDKRVRDLEVSGRPVTLLWDRRRLVCDGCGRRFLEVHRAFEGRVTARLARRLVADAREMTVNAVARRHRVGWHTVMGLVIAYAGLVGEHRRRRRCRVLLVDETSIRKRHRYVTVLVNGDTGETLAMVPHRSETALSGFLASQGHRWCKGVKVVVSDGSKSYAAAIAKRLGHARHVLDRFHVVRWFAAGLTAVRRDVQRRAEGSKPAFDPQVFRARFVLMRRPDTLDAAERKRLNALFGGPSPGSRRHGTRSASCTASISRRTARAPSKRSTGSPTSTAAGRYPSSAAPSTRSWHGMSRSSTGTKRGGLAVMSSEVVDAAGGCAADGGVVPVEIVGVHPVLEAASAVGF